MIVQCPSCGSRYRVNDANIPSSGGKIRCPSCSRAFVVYPEDNALFSDDDEEGKTSIASQPSLDQLLKNMQRPEGEAGPETGIHEKSEGEVARTEVMSGGELPDFAKLMANHQELDLRDDGTVEMANPFQGMDPKRGLSASDALDNTLDSSVFAVQESAIEQAAGSPQADMSHGVDPEHAGPWKLKTDFGLTYEFPGTKGLKSWLINRDDVEGYTVSADGQTFHDLKDIAQLQDVIGPKMRQKTASSAGSSPQKIGPPSSKGSRMQLGHLGAESESERSDISAAPQKKKRIASSSYRPPSRDAKWNALLWALFAVLFGVALVLAVHVAGLIDVKALVLGDSTPAQSVQASADEPTVVDDDKAEAQAGDDKSRAYDQLLEAAQHLMEEQNFEQALEELSQARDMIPSNVAVYVLMVEVYEALEQDENAQEMRDMIEKYRAQDAQQQNQDSHPEL